MNYIPAYQVVCKICRFGAVYPKDAKFPDCRFCGSNDYEIRCESVIIQYSIEDDLEKLQEVERDIDALDPEVIGIPRDFKEVLLRGVRRNIKIEERNIGINKRILGLIKDKAMSRQDIERYFWDKYHISISIIDECLKNLLNNGDVDKIVVDGTPLFKIQDKKTGG